MVKLERLTTLEKRLKGVKSKDAWLSNPEHVRIFSSNENLNGNNIKIDVQEKSVDRKKVNWMIRSIQDTDEIRKGNFHIEVKVFHILTFFYLYVEQSIENIFIYIL